MPNGVVFGRPVIIQRGTSTDDKGSIAHIVFGIDEFSIFRE
jgi:hypothetical protein